MEKVRVDVVRNILQAPKSALLFELYKRADENGIFSLSREDIDDIVRKNHICTHTFRLYLSQWTNLNIIHKLEMNKYRFNQRYMPK